MQVTFACGVSIEMLLAILGVFTQSLADLTGDLTILMEEPS